MEQMKRMLLSEGIKLIMLPFDKDGYASLNKNMIFVNQDLPEKEQTKVILHELGHFKQKDYIKLYDEFVQHSKMEAEANEFMVKNVVSSYIEEHHLEKEQLNSVKLLEWTGLDTKYQDYVEQFLYAYPV